MSKPPSQQLLEFRKDPGDLELLSAFSTDAKTPNAVNCSSASIAGDGTQPTTPAKTSKDGMLRKHADYQRVYKVSRKQFSPSMTWFLAARAASGSRTTTDIPRVGLTVGKVIGKAHERNRIKRRMREAVRQHFHELPNGTDIILHPRRTVMTLDFVKLEAEILRIFRQANTQMKNPVTQKPRDPQPDCGGGPRLASSKPKTSKPLSSSAATARPASSKRVRS